MYTFVVLDAFGRGPFIRPGVILSSDRFNRVDMVMQFAYDVGCSGPSGSHREIGQTFVATGRDIIVVDARGPAADTILLTSTGRAGR